MPFVLRQEKLKCSLFFFGGGGRRKLCCVLCLLFYINGNEKFPDQFLHGGRCGVYFAVVHRSHNNKNRHPARSTKKVNVFFSMDKSLLGYLSCLSGFVKMQNWAKYHLRLFRNLKRDNRSTKENFRDVNSLKIFCSAGMLVNYQFEKSAWQGWGENCLETKSLEVIYENG